MKISTLIVLLTLLFSSNIWARSYPTPTMTVFRSIETELNVKFIKAGRGLPENWDELQVVNKYQTSPNKVSIFYLRAINSLAMVPGAPVLKTPLPVRMKGRRIFAVSREAGLDGAEGSGEKGRYAILVEKDGGSCFVTWLEEEFIEMILKEVDSFVPTEQPKAFDDTTVSSGIPSVANPELTSKNSDTRVSKNVANARDATPRTKDSTFERSNKEGNAWRSWQAVLVVVLIVSIWFARRSAKEN